MSSETREQELARYARELCGVNPADRLYTRSEVDALIAAERERVLGEIEALPPADDFARGCVESMRHNAQRMREQCKRERSRAEAAEAKLAELRASVESVCRKLVAPIPHKCERYGACSQCMIDSQREDLARELLGDAAIDAMKGKP